MYRAHCSKCRLYFELEARVRVRVRVGVRVIRAGHNRSGGPIGNRYNAWSGILTVFGEDDTSVTVRRNNRVALQTMPTDA